MTQTPSSALRAAVAQLFGRDASWRSTSGARPPGATMHRSRRGLRGALIGATVLAIGPTAAVVGLTLTSVASAVPAPMTLTFNTSLAGSTTLTLPVTPSAPNSVTVDWGDGATSTSLTHTYATAGTYHLSISGSATHFGNTAGWIPSPGVTAVTSFGALGITDWSGAFDGATNLRSVPSELPTGATNLASMFAGAQDFNQPIGGWNTAAVTDMSNMFANAHAFNQPIGGWNTAAVTNMSGMFGFANAFNQPIGHWNTANVTDMNGMFAQEYAFNQPLGGWNTSKVTNMSAMFDAAVSFNQPIGTWNTATVTNMSSMFAYDFGFNQPLGAWHTAAVTNMSSMFSADSAFNQPLGAWHTAAVTNMSGMFASALAFNQPLGGWNIAAVTNLTGMFSGGAGLSTSNYNALLLGWAAQSPHHDLVLDAGFSTYNAAASAAHNILTAADGWTITDNGLTSAKAKPQITRLPSISITYGHKLTNANLVGGTANTPGTFALTRRPSSLSVGTHLATVTFRPTDAANYTTITAIVPVHVNKIHLTLALSSLKTVPHGRSVTITVLHVVAGARVTVRWQLAHKKAAATTLTAKRTSVKAAVILASKGTYTLTASATKPNYTFTSATGSMKAS